jgi:hypothetical protein
VVDNEGEGEGEGYRKGDDERERTAHLLVAGIENRPASHLKRRRRG